MRSGSSKNVGHHGWLGFEWIKTTQMALKFLRFSGAFLNMFRIFLVRQNKFYEFCSFCKGIFFIKIQKFKKGSVQNETMYTSISNHFQDVLILLLFGCENLFNTW